MSNMSFSNLQYKLYNSFFRPANAQELFNLRHSSLRNVVERIFGVCKRRFKLMVAAPQYSLSTQAKIPAALAALHNFIRIFDPDDGALDDDGGDDQSQGASLPGMMGEINQDHLGHYITQVEKDRANERRDNIARAMWEQYQGILADHEGM